jgi:voltage-gated sodium channel
MERLSAIVKDPRTERIVIGLIILNALTLGLETSPTIMAEWGSVLYALDKLLLAVFVVEIVARIAVWRLPFFRDPWNVFDFIVIVIALLPATGTLSVLRALRVLRVLRLITLLPSLKRVVGALVGALPGMGSIVLLLGLFLYVGAVMSTKLFGASFEDKFGTLGASVFTLVQLMTLDGWSGEIVRPVLEVYPLAWPFFLVFIVATAFTLMNLFIGVVVNAMQAEHEAAQAEKAKAEKAEEEAVVLREIQGLREEVARLRVAMEGRVG